MDCLLVLDQGSASSRAALVDREGHVTAIAQFPVTTTSPRTGWIEHHPHDLLGSQMAAVRAVLAKRGPGQTIRAVGLATQRSTVLLWDPSSGQALSPAISWQDQRTAAWCHRRAKASPLIRHRTGLFLSPHYAASKMRWLLDHVPGARRLASRGALCCGTVNSYLIWHLSKGRLFVTDEANAARTLLYNLTTRQWDRGLLDFFGIPAACLPRVTPTTGILGKAVIDGRTIPITTSIGDQQAALAGLGCARPGQMGLNYGTGGFLLVNTGTRPRRVKGLLTGLAWSLDGQPPTYMLEGPVNAVGSAIQWVTALLGIREDWTTLDGWCKRAQAPPVFLLAPFGLGAPHWDPRMVSCLLGLTPRTRPEDLIRATVDAVACLIADIYAKLRQAGVRVTEIRAGGGVAALSTLLQRQADLLGKPLVRSDPLEVTLLGTAWLTGVGCGLWTLEQATARLKVTRRFRPGHRAEARRLYARWQAALRLGRLWRQAT